jgi:hypothetical protein
MSDTALITFPSAGQNTLALFLAAQSQALGDSHHEILNEIARATTERGWVPPPDALIAKLVDHGGLARDKLADALADLVHRRLVTLADGGQAFTAFLGCVSLVPTPHRAHLANGIDLYVHGGLELLAVNSMLLRPVDAFTRCPVTGKELKLTIADEAISKAEPSGISGFMAEWDGFEPLADVAARSPLFADDEAMEKWVAENPAIKGTELPGDLLLWVGMEAAKQLGELRFKLIGHHG